MSAGDNLNIPTETFKSYTFENSSSNYVTKNELTNALANAASFASTYMPLAGGTFTGPVDFSAGIEVATLTNGGADIDVDDDLVLQPTKKVRFDDGSTILDIDHTYIGGVNTNLSTLSSRADNLEALVGSNNVSVIESRLTTAESGLSTITGLVDGNDVTAIESRVTVNEAAIADHETRLSTAESGLSTVTGLVGGNDVTAIESRVTVNEAAIADHETRLGTAESGLSTVTGLVGGLDVTAIESRVTTNEADISDHETRVTSLELSGGTDTISAVNDALLNAGFSNLLSRHFPASFIGFYDFAIADNLGRDISGSSNHLTLHGTVDYTNDVTHGRVAKFEHNTAEPDTYSNTIINSYRGYRPFLSRSVTSNSEFSVSFWAKPYYASASNIYLAAFSFSDRTAGALRSIIVRWNNNRWQMGFFDPGGLVVINQGTSQPANTWYHVAFTVSASANKFYVNGTRLTSYTNGSAASGFATSSINAMTIGGVINQPLMDQGEDMIAFPFEGEIADVIIKNGIFTDADVTNLYNKDYGYGIIVLAGQSNMVGIDEGVAGIDDVYTLQDGRVFQYETINNVNSSTQAVTAHTISAATGRLLHPHPTADGTTGLWKTFSDLFIPYSDFPEKKNLLFLPVAYGGTGFQDGAWTPTSGAQYQCMRNTMQDLVTSAGGAYNHMNHISGFFWQHGERDIALLNTNYKASFDAMIAQLAIDVPDFNVSTTPMILGTVNGYYESYVSGGYSVKKIVNDDLGLIAADGNYRALVDTDGLSMKTDYIHFTTTSLRKVGTLYYNAWVEATKSESGLRDTNPYVDCVSMRLDVDDNLVQITTLQSFQTSATADISDHETRIADLETFQTSAAADISDHETRIADLETFQTSATTDISDLETLTSGITATTDKVYIGTNTGATGGSTSTNSIAIGASAGMTDPGNYSTNIGLLAGQTTCGSQSISMGRSAGQTSSGADSVSIGTNAGRFSCGSKTVNIGYQSGYGNTTAAGASSVIIGEQAGYEAIGSNCIAIGTKSNYNANWDNCIVLNATGVAKNPQGPSSCILAPMRSVTHYNGSYRPLAIDPVYNEVFIMNEAIQVIAAVSFSSDQYTFPETCDTMQNTIFIDHGNVTEAIVFLPVPLSICVGKTIKILFKGELSSTKAFNMKCSTAGNHYWVGGAARSEYKKGGSNSNYQNSTTLTVVSIGGTPYYFSGENTYT